MYCNKALFEVSTFLFTQKYVSAQDFHLIYEVTKRTSPEFIDFQLQHMRVNRSELNALAETLMIPGQFPCPNGTVASGFEGLCIILRRFAYQCRFADMIHRSVAELRFKSSKVVDFIYATHGYLLRKLNHAGMACATISARVCKCSSSTWSCINQLLRFCGRHCPTNLSSWPAPANCL